MAKERSGVMLYYDRINPALEQLDDTQCGQLLRFIIDYAEHGSLPGPEHDGSQVLFAFKMLRPSIDHDAESYAEKQRRGRYTRYKAAKENSGQEPLSYEEWKSMVDYRR